MTTLSDLLKKWLGLTCKCSRCGRTLKDKKSVRRGMGPECWKAYQKELKKCIEETKDLLQRKEEIK